MQEDDRDGTDTADGFVPPIIPLREVDLVHLFDSIQHKFEEGVHFYPPSRGSLLPYKNTTIIGTLKFAFYVVLDREKGSLFLEMNGAATEIKVVWDDDERISRHTLWVLYGLLLKSRRSRFVHKIID